MHAILMTTLTLFLLEHKNSSNFFEICLPSEDSPWMKQAVVVSLHIYFIGFSVICTYKLKSRKRLNICVFFK